MPRRMELNAVGGNPGALRGGNPILPSRLDLLRRCREGLGRGPVLLTGEPGSGKTWLLDQLIESDSRTWIRADLAPSIGPADLHQELGRALGVEPGPQARIELSEALREQADLGRYWGLALDEAHLGTPDTLEEIRVLANRLGQPDGFAAMLLVGQGTLVRRLRTRALLGLQARLAAHLHVLPISLEEATILLDHLFPEEAPGRDWVSRWHRESLGNPGLLIRRVGQSRRTRTVLLDAAQAAVRPVGLAPVAATSESEPEQPFEAPVLKAVSPGLIETPPPIEVDDGTIEVGWTADDLPEVSSYDDESERAAELATGPEVMDERPVVVEDHYAALQAWNEWAANQGRAVASGEMSGLNGSSGPSPLEGRDDVRAEPQHGHAPYGPLFARRVSSPDA